nr:MAG TPA: hypothetical protein [Caudoviricetes sp.]
MSAATGRPPANPEKHSGTGSKTAQPDKQTPGCESRAGTKPTPRAHRARTPREGPPMTTINEIKDRLNAVAFAGRSYAGADRAAIAKAYTDAVAAFDQNAAVDMAYLLDRVDEMQDAIAVAASDLADVASYIAARYAGTPDEASEIRLAIGEPIDALVNVSQGTPITPEEAGE